MFLRVWQWIKEFLNKMINKTDVKTSLGVEVAISSLMADALQTWSLMYANQATWLKKDEVFSLNLPATIASEVTRAVTLEMKVKLGDSPRAVYLQEQLDVAVGKLRTQLEYGCAKGGLMMKPYVSGKKILVDFVQADQFYPVAFDASGNITSCVFSDQRQIAGKFYTRLEYHKFTAGVGDKLGSCEIKNQAYKSTSINELGTACALTEVDVWKDLLPTATIKNLKEPIFAYFRYPAANNIDPASPLGVSVYARSVDLIGQADKQWSMLLWEFDSGQRAIYVDELAFDKDSNKKPILPNRRLYRTMKTSGMSKEDMFEDWSPTFREQEILNGLEAILRKIEFNCGLSYGTISNPDIVSKTATELKISKQRYYSTITDVQKALELALGQLIRAMDNWATMSNLVAKGPINPVYDFDDSILVDKDMQFQMDLRLLDRVMGKVEFRMRNMGEDEETAKKAIDKLTAEQPKVDLLGNPIIPGTKPGTKPGGQPDGQSGKQPGGKQPANMPFKKKPMLPLVKEKQNA